MAVSLELFIANLVRSGLFTAAELATFQQNLPPDRQPRKPQDLARELIRAVKLTKYQAAQVYQGKTRGLALGEYVIQDEIGHGGMGEVFKAWHAGMERVIAVKVLPAKMMQSRDAIERFRREVKAAAKLMHPNIVTAHHAGEHEGIHYLVMEYIEGKDLANVLAERGPLPVEEAVDYVMQAARGLECAHEQGVIHRDIKPANLLLDQRGTVKILDMGLARIDRPAGPYAPTASEPLTESGRVMGTYDYMAPEQAADTHTADHRSDIYSLGCTLFRLLTGQRPYHGDTPVAVLLAHCQAPLPSVRQLREEVSPELEGVVHKMLAKSPADRQQSMGEVIAELEHCIRPVLGPEPPTPPPVARSATASSSSSDSALKGFLRKLSGATVAAQPVSAFADEETAQFQREETGAMVRPATTPARKRSSAPVIIGAVAAAAALLLIAGLVAWRGQNREKQPAPAETAQARTEQPSGATPTNAEAQVPQADTQLVLRWPALDRADAKVVIDSEPLDVAELVDGEHPDQVTVPLSPGEHSVWIARRGYEPFERRFIAAAGEGIVLEPIWKEFTAGVETSPSEHSMPPAEEAATPEPPAVAGTTAGDHPEPDAAAPQEAGEPTEVAIAEADPALKRQQELEKEYAEALTPVDAKVAEWDFAAAAQLLEQIRFEEDQLSARLAIRKEEVRRLAAFKEKVIDAINSAEAPLKKIDMKLRGIGGTVTGAGERGITATLISGSDEFISWGDVGEQATAELLKLAVDRDNADDLLAGGLLASAAGDAALAERLLEQARSSGADISPYLVRLAASSFRRATQLLDEGRFEKADALLGKIEEKYADNTWFASRIPAFGTAQAKAEVGVLNFEAENLYAEAVELLHEDKLFDMKPLVESLKTQYGNSN